MEPKKKVTAEKVMLFRMAQGINRWLWSQNDNPRYQNRLDLECEIVHVLEEALERAAELCERHGFLEPSREGRSEVKEILKSLLNEDGRGNPLYKSTDDMGEKYQEALKQAITWLGGEHEPSREAGNAFEEWTAVFPGKMGLSWKRAWDGVGTKEEAEAEASKNCNVVAVPLRLFEHIKEMERRMVEAEHKLKEEYKRSLLRK